MKQNNPLTQYATTCLLLHGSILREMNCLTTEQKITSNTIFLSQITVHIIFRTTIVF